jgi:hypothetical protein
VRVDLEVLGVERNGAPEDWFTERRDNGVRINTGGDAFLPVPGEYTFTLRYRTMAFRGQPGVIACLHIVGHFIFGTAATIAALGDARVALGRNLTGSRRSGRVLEHPLVDRFSLPAWV